MGNYRIAAVGLAMFGLIGMAWAQATQQSRPTQPGEQVTTPAAQRPQSGQQRAQQPVESQPQLSQEPGRAPQERRGRPAEEKTSVTHHTAHIGGQQIEYTATAGTYVIKADDGTPKASFFFVAYTKDNVGDPARRPVSFVYNGGPGSASLFTHMGLGPRRVALMPDGRGTPAPYVVEDNRDSFLDATDMIFVDAISTGYSLARAKRPINFTGLSRMLIGFPISSISM